MLRPQLTVGGVTLLFLLAMAQAGCDRPQIEQVPSKKPAEPPVQDDVKPATFWTYKCVHCGAVEAASLLRALLDAGESAAEDKGATVVAVKETNSLFVRAPADKLARAKAFLERLDVEVSAGDKAAVLKTYKVVPGQAEVIARVLQGIYQESPGTRVAAGGQSTVVVFASAQEQQAVESLLARGRRLRLAEAGPQPAVESAVVEFGVSRRRHVKPAIGALVLRTYMVSNGNAEAVARALRQIYRESEYVRITAVGHGSIMVYGPQEEQSAVDTLLLARRIVRGR